MRKRIVDTIRRKTRQQWRALVFDRWTTIRIWVQEHGEKSALLALVAGIVLVLAFKLVVFIFIVTLLVGYIIYFTALDEKAAELPEPERLKNRSDPPGA